MNFEPSGAVMSPLRLSPKKNSGVQSAPKHAPVTRLPVRVAPTSHLQHAAQSNAARTPEAKKTRNREMPGRDRRNSSTHRLHHKASGRTTIDADNGLR
jgi:hypothetical protein